MTPIEKIKAREAELSSAMRQLADAFSYAEEPHAPSLRLAVELLDLIDPVGLEEFFEALDPSIIAHALAVLGAMVANAERWGRAGRRDRQ
ncbi:MAG TPA: hypothetical protein VFE60_17660 [Roseiarcus sp.]|jgi:hypothetical protein|nr:hypothetical protein [Roseiarcus sp.]